MHSVVNEIASLTVFSKMVDKCMLFWAFLFGFVFVSFSTFATHNRAGEIIYKRVNSNPFLYEISIITYTKTGGASDAADRCDLELFFGDGTSEVVNRSNGFSNGDCDAGVGQGVMIAENTRYNVYTTQHVFPGQGTYRLSMEDPMRNGGIVNIDNSDNVPFYIESNLTIDIATGGNQAPVLQNPPIDDGCLGVPFEHNPGAVDPEGDSLVYSLVGSKTYGGESINNYRLPDEIEPGPNNNLSIDPNTGTMTWDSPQLAGEYNVAILIEEYRTNPNSGAVFKVGSVLRDMQIDIGNCPPNDPPFIMLDNQVCITAGEVLLESATAIDPEGGDLTFSAVGYPLDEGNGGVLDPEGGIEGKSPLELTLRWQTSCDNVRYAPYWVYFKAKEKAVQNTELVDFESMEITVVSPAVSITQIEPKGTSLEIDWTRAVCDKATGYDIYRFNDSLGYVGDNCITGVPSELGYEKIGTIDDINTTSYVDDDNEEGLVHGQRYCYMIVTLFADGSESYPSQEACGKLIRDVPILNRVSVNSTDTFSGEDSIAWYPPIELNTQNFGPPYRYRLLRADSGEFEEVYLSESSNDFFSLDTVFVDRNLNTSEVQYKYKIEMLSGAEEVSVGVSRSASSVFLRSEPSDNTLTLFWDVSVPWSNHQYVVYRFSNEDGSLDESKVLDTVSGTSYVDDRLANEVEYRYFVQSIGRYSAEDLSDTLFNKSQIHAGIPIDNEPPCAPPNQLIEGDCDLEQTLISWSNPNELCDDVDDVVAYRIYYTPVFGQAPTVLTEINDPDVLEYSHNSNGSIAGCYALVAVDSFDNESPSPDTLCVDNCPVYELPNVFTPGDDNRNDLFVPFPYKFVESIDLVVYNRWGVEVFKTTDPDINWDGTDMRTGKPLSSGVYFYICVVNEVRLQGIVSRELKGDLHLLREGEKPPLAP
ncbi:MAG: gliding motility-associated C-terminal domain-containing protein [Salibacteraceae bacterium]